MTRTLRTPILPLFLLLSFCFGASIGQAAPAKKSARFEKSSRAKREQASNKKSSAKETRAEKNDRRAGGRKDRQASRRERLAQARREAEERRRRAEAARRAELARLAAIARQRAIDQSFRQEAAANVLRDDTTGEDLEVRRVAQAALGNHAGSVVVMDPQTGRIYTIVNQDWGIRRGFKPCSTIKLVTGLAGLEEGVIEPATELNKVSLQATTFDLTDALAFSHNGFFQRVGSRVGFERLSSYARQLGLGEPTGINHVSEFAGRVPLYRNERAILRMSSHGDDFEVTPVQLASLVSVFANGGTLFVPHLPRTPQENVKFKAEVRRQLNIPQEVLRRMLPGMIGAVSYGSGKKSHDPAQTIAGKTGTCIGAGGQWVGLFTSYAPVQDPRLAIAVVTRGADARAHLPAAIAGQIYRTLNYRFGKRGNGVPYTLTPEMLAPRPKVDPNTITDEGADEADAGEAAGVNTTAAAPTATPGASNVRQVLQPIRTRPTGVTTMPAKPAPNGKSPNQQPQPGEGRPRRVLTNTPELP